MKRTYPILLIPTMLLFIGGCASSGSSGTDFDDTIIPEGALEIMLYTEREPDDYIGYLRRKLEDYGFNIMAFSPVENSLTASLSDIGRGIDIVVFAGTETDEMVQETRARFSGLVDNGTEFARWSTTDDNKAFAFGELAEILHNMDHTRVVYSVEQGQ